MSSCLPCTLAGDAQAVFPIVGRAAIRSLHSLAPKTLAAALQRYWLSSLNSVTVFTLIHTHTLQFVVLGARHRSEGVTRTGATSSVMWNPGRALIRRAGSSARRGCAIWAPTMVGQRSEQYSGFLPSPLGIADQSGRRTASHCCGCLSTISLSPANAHGMIRYTIGGWELCAILTVRTGDRLVITQNCASDWDSRSDYAGAATVPSDWEPNSTSRCTVGARCAAVPEPQCVGSCAGGSSDTDCGPAWELRRWRGARPRELVDRHVSGQDFPADAWIWRLAAICQTQQIASTIARRAPTYNDATFGEISGAGGMRVVQLNAKLRW